MLNEEHGRGVFRNQLFNLSAGININKVQRLVPDIQMGFFAKTACNQRFLFLSAGKIRNVLFKLRPLKSEFPEQSLEQAFIDPVCTGIFGT